jgi:lipoprotein signal peptidase
MMIVRLVGGGKSLDVDLYWPHRRHVGAAPSLEVRHEGEADRGSGYAGHSRSRAPLDHGSHRRRVRLSAFSRAGAGIAFVRAAAPLAIVCVAVDQAVKFLVERDLPVCRQTPIVDCTLRHLGPLTVANVPAVPPVSWSIPTSPPWIRVQNTGAGFVLVREPTVALGLALLGCLLLVTYAVWLGQTSWIASLGVGLQAGGALSNLLDRVLAGHVTDYVNLTPTLTFNLADVFLLLGTVLATAGIAVALIRSVPGEAGRASAPRREQADPPPG